MACANGDLLFKLKALVNDLEGSGCPCPPPCTIPPNTLPFATCCMVCPPPILAPTSPEPVKPLQLPCPPNSTNNAEPPMTVEEAERSRVANFYNNYNIDWHADAADPHQDSYIDPRKDKYKGVTTDGKSPYCPKENSQGVGRLDCPTGFKPCKMKLTPPENCHPCGIWCAEIQPCPPKPRKKKTVYEPPPCTKPGCKHWEPKDGPCKYSEPCKAHCVNH